MFNKEQFVEDYVEAVRKNDSQYQQEVLGRLTEDQDWDDRTSLVKEIIEKVKDLDGDHQAQTDFLQNQIKLLEVAKMQEQRKEDSANEEAKDNTEAEEATPDVAADVSADETAVESGGYAPTTEEQTEKPEDK